MSAIVDEHAPAGSKKYVNFDEYVDFQVNKTRSGIRLADLWQAVLTVFVILGGYLLLFVVADHWLIEGGFSFAPRLVMLLAVGTFLGGWIVSKIILPYWKRVTALYAARELEQSQPGLKSSLLTLVDLKRAQRNVSPQILSAMEKRAALQLSEINVEEAVDRRPLMRLAVALLAVVVGLCVYTVLSPKPIGASLLRALVPVSDIGVATRTRILNVAPGNANILARSQLEVTVDLEGEIPTEATLLYSTRDRSLKDEPVVLRDTGEGLNRFRGTLSGPNGRGLLQDFTYRVTAGDAVSETYNVTVKQAPYATIESITYTYPKYMGLDAKTQTSGDIDAWEGTQIAIHAVTNMPVAGATLRLHDSEDTSLKAEERALRVVDETNLELTLPWTLEFRSDGTYPHYYSIDLRTADGQRDPVPRLYGLTIRRDLPPEIQLLHPSGDVQLPANAVLPVSFAARDPDFMLRSVRMHFAHRGQPLETKTRHLYDAPPFRSEVAGRSEIDLARFEDLNLKPGDVLTFWLEAWDNMAPLGNRPGNRSVTSKINIAITDPASAEEIEQRREEEAAAADQRLDEAQSQSNEETPDAEAAPGERSAGDESEGSADEAAAAGDAESEGTQSQRGSGESTDQRQRGTTDGGSGQGDPSTSAEPAPNDSDPSGQPQSSGEQTGANREQQPGDQGAPDANEDGGESGNRASKDGGSRQPKSPPDPALEAPDDEALERLFDEYASEIEQLRRQEQQRQQREQQPQQQPQQDSQSGNRGDSNQDQTGRPDSGTNNGSEQAPQPPNVGPPNNPLSSGAVEDDPPGRSPDQYKGNTRASE